MKKRRRSRAATVAEVLEERIVLWQPNQVGAMGLKEFVERARSFEQAALAADPNISQQQILDNFVAYLKDQEDWSYVYTTEAGWIDMQHFTECASWQWLPNDVVASAGVTNEFYQTLIGPIVGLFGGPGSSGSGNSGSGDGFSSSNDTFNSGFTMEDLPSNSYGIAFQDWWDGESSLSDALEEFLTTMGTVENPQEAAPDYGSLPKDEEDFQNTSSWYDPYVRMLFYIRESMEQPVGRGIDTINSVVDQDSFDWMYGTWYPESLRDDPINGGWDYAGF